MGGKCFGVKQIKESEDAYPKFTYVTTEAAMKVKFINPSKILTQKIMLQPEKRLPSNALTCKISSSQFIIVGGLSLYRWTLCAAVYELDFESKTIKDKAECPFIPIRGSLYRHNHQVYLIGSATDLTSVNDVEVEVIPYPFKKINVASAREEHKGLKPCNFYRYSLVRDRWKEVALNDDVWDEEVEIDDKVLPSKLLLPGTCKVDEKILFFSGLVEKGNEWQANENIYWFSLNSRKIGIMKTKFEFGGFTEMKCARVTKKTVLILGGFGTGGHYNTMIFEYVVDSRLQGISARIKDGINFCDNCEPVGKYSYGIFFAYPEAFLIKAKSERIEYLNLRCE